MHISIHFDLRDDEYGVTAEYENGVQHFADIASDPDTILATLGPVNPGLIARIGRAGDLAYLANQGQLTPPAIDAAAAADGYGTIGYLLA